MPPNPPFQLLSRLTTLQSLTLMGCHMHCLPPALSALRNLRVLYLGGPPALFVFFLLFLFLLAAYPAGLSLYVPRWAPAPMGLLRVLYLGGPPAPLCPFQRQAGLLRDSK